MTAKTKLPLLFALLGLSLWSTTSNAACHFAKNNEVTKEIIDKFAKEAIPLPQKTVLGQVYYEQMDKDKPGPVSLNFYDHVDKGPVRWQGTLWSNTQRPNWIKLEIKGGGEVYIVAEAHTQICDVTGTANPENIYKASFIIA